MIARRLTLTGLACVCALTGALMFGGVSAQALLIHDYLPEVSKKLSEGVPASSGAAVTGPVSEVGSMTVDSGHVWVAEHIGGTNTFRVDQFDAGTGAFVSQLPQVSPVAGLEEVGQSVAVAHGSVYVGAVESGVAQDGRLAVFSEAGVLQATWTGAATPAGSFGKGGVADVAVDNSVSGLASGSVYVDDQAQRVVDVFGSEGVGSESPVAEPSAGHVRVLEGTCPVEGTACEPLEVIRFNTPSRVAVDDSTGNVLVLDKIEEEVEGAIVSRGVIDVFKPGALGGYVFLRQIRLPAGDQVVSVAVDGGSGEIYAGGYDVGGVGFVDQFSSAGVLLGRITGEGTPAGNLRAPQSMAVDSVSHRVFVGDYREGRSPSQPSVIDVFGPDLVIPDVTTGSALSVTPRGATLNGTVNPDGAGEATCRFVWGTTTEFGQATPCPNPVAQGTTPVPVQVALTGLQPGTTYYYRLQASNAKGTNLGESGQTQSFTTSGPGIHVESVLNVATTTATFDAVINPNNAPTTYYFQYGTGSGYSNEVPVAPGAPLGSGGSDVEVSAQVQGLSVGTTYHYRVVAVSELAPGVFEAFDGPDQIFTTETYGGPLVLPDGRAWELVSPVNKHGGAIRSDSGLGQIQASVSGDAITYLATLPTELEPQGFAEFAQILSVRDASGWSSRVIATPHSGPQSAAGSYGTEYRFFSQDLGQSVVEPFGPFTELSEQAPERAPYLRRESLCDAPATARECYLPLVTAKEPYADVPPGTNVGGPPNAPSSEYPFEYATPDLKHVILDRSGLGSYEWSAGKPPSQELQLVTKLPKSEGGHAVANSFGRGGSITSAPYVRHALSDDGSRIFFSYGGHLYARDTVSGESEAVRLDVAQGVAEPNNEHAEFEIANTTGSRVFFTAGRLTEHSNTAGDLYVCDLVEEDGKPACRLSDLTPHQSESAPEASVRAVVGASNDGSYVYFLGGGALAIGSSPGDCTREESTRSCNLYVVHYDGSGWGAPRLVAALSQRDGPDWQTLQLENESATVRVSPNGRYLSFMSERSLTGYDNRDVNSGKPDEELYLYDVRSGKLVCASCNPTGARPVGIEVTEELGAPNLVVGGNTWKPGHWLAADVPGWNAFMLGLSLYQPRYLSDQGRLFFDSSDALVPQDVNGTWDVYEFEPVGIGSCVSSGVTFSSVSGGCVGLVSSGASGEESVFFDASEGGGHVFFLTSERLTRQDVDTAYDVYDAQICDASAPCVPLPVSPPGCTTAEACRAAPVPQPSIFGSPSSATFSGAGNISQSGSPPGVKSRSTVLSQRLARALRVCHAKRSRHKRAVCERRARRQYAVQASGKANAKRGGAR